MNFNTDKVFFDNVKSDFMNNNGQTFDEEIKEVVLRWKNSPVLNKICPRWSCQSHVDDKHSSDYYIIFCTQDDGANFLYDVVLKGLMERSTNYGIQSNAWKYQVLHLMNIIDGYPTLFEPHIEISCSTFGNEYQINVARHVWLDLLMYIEETYGE